MSNTMRWRYGDTNPVMAPVKSATVIEIGDMVWQEMGNAWPASMLPHQGSREANQQLFAEKFLGVVMQRSSRAGNIDRICVATSGVFESDCTSATFELGGHVGPEENTGGDGLLNQHVVAVYASQYAVARCARQASIAVPRVLIDICSTVMRGGINGTTARTAKC